MTRFRWSALTQKPWHATGKRCKHHRFDPNSTIELIFFPPRFPPSILRIKRNTPVLVLEKKKKKKKRLLI